MRVFSGGNQKEKKKVERGSSVFTKKGIANILGDSMHLSVSEYISLGSQNYEKILPQGRFFLIKNINCQNAWSIIDCKNNSIQKHNVTK